MNSFSFEDKGPRFTKLKPSLALRLLSKGLFYIRAMLGIKRINSNSDEERGHEVPNFVANIIKCNTSAFKGE